MTQRLVIIQKRTQNNKLYSLLDYEQHLFSEKAALRINGEIRVHGVEFSRILFYTDDLLI